MAGEKIIDFKCSNCGGALKTTGHVNGKVECPFCHTESFIDGLIKNAEILEKENINSGVSIDLTKDALNKCVIDAITKIYAFPLDIFENGNIIKEEHICIPSYLFYCNGMAAYTYEIGKERIQQTVRESGKIAKEMYTEWTQAGSTTSASDNVIAPGNREYSEVITKVFGGYDVSRLVDIEDLILPTDVETYKFNYPQPAVFSEIVKPHMENLLIDTAVATLGDKDYRDLTIGGCNVQKDEVLRLTLGLYKLELQYNDKVYTLYVAGDGGNYWFKEQPYDVARTQLYNELEERQEKLSKNIFMKVAIGCTVAALFTSGISLLGTGLFGYLWYKRKKDLKEAKAQYEALIQEEDNIKQNFIQSGKCIKGIN